MDWYDAWWWEWAGLLTGVWCVVLVIRQSLWNWPISIVNNVVLIALFVPRRLYADAALQVVYIVLAAYGWWHWLHGNPAARDALPVRRTPRLEAVAVLAVGVAGFLAAGLVLDRWTDSDVPWADAFPTVASLAAQYLLTRKYLGSWCTWILLVNLPYAYLYAIKDLPVLVAFQGLLIVLSVQGWRSWRAEMAGGPPAPRPVGVEVGA